MNPKLSRIQACASPVDLWLHLSGRRAHSKYSAVRPNNMDNCGGVPVSRVHVRSPELIEGGGGAERSYCYLMRAPLSTTSRTLQFFEEAAVPCQQGNVRKVTGGACVLQVDKFLFVFISFTRNTTHPFFADVCNSVEAGLGNVGWTHLGVVMAVLKRKGDQAQAVNDVKRNFRGF
ncbi:hypothetical protein MRX96_035879 [Rhipicephalus microplus]